MITALAAISVGAVLTASAGPAHAASAPMSMTISPAVTAVQVGQHDYVSHIKVTDSGTKSLTVTSGVRLITQGSHGAALGPGPAWATLSGPTRFDLAPGQSTTVTLSLAAPPSVHSSQDVSALFVAAPVTRSSAVGVVGGAIASRVILRLDGSAAVPSYKNSTVAAPTHASTPAWAWLAAVVILLAGLVLLIRRTVRRRRRVTS